MALTHWKSSEDFFAEPWRGNRELVPYWRRNWLWDDYGVFRDVEQRAWELERKLHTEFVELIPRYGINGFKVLIDVSPFLPSELTVKTNENSVEVEGKHEEYRFGHRMVLQEFTRRYTLPPGYNANAITSELSANGILTIKAPAPDTSEHFINRFKPSGYKAIKKVRF